MNENTAIKYWIALKWVDSLGNIGMKTLLSTIGAPQQIFETPRHMLSAVPGIGKVITDHIKSFQAWSKVEREMELACRHQVSIITYDDPLYPPALKHIYDCPMYLYVKGKLNPDDITVAIVGSRRASLYGKFSTEKLSRELSLKGVTVVSGMARGIDASAHQGALSVRGRTIAVLGSGIDVVYPPENRGLYEAIPEHGALISEYPFGTPPNAPNFPARNRIISGLSLGVVVVEASDKSGSLITARIALDQGREVFAIPGSIDSPGSRGTHKLIKEGATLVENAEDILTVILPQATTRPPAVIPSRSSARELSDARPAPKDPLNRPQPLQLSLTESKIISTITEKPVHIDAIIQSTQLKAAEVLNALMCLELYGVIRQLPGKMFAREEGTECLNH